MFFNDVFRALIREFVASHVAASLFAHSSPARHCLKPHPTQNDATWDANVCGIGMIKSRALRLR
jgi:hypothetical protein